EAQKAPHPIGYATAPLGVHRRHRPNEPDEGPGCRRHAGSLACFVVAAAQRDREQSYSTAQGGFFQMDARAARNKIRMASWVWGVHHWNLADSGDRRLHPQPEETSRKKGLRPTDGTRDPFAS